jgi:hypothetical protein
MLSDGDSSVRIRRFVPIWRRKKGNLLTLRNVVPLNQLLLYCSRCVPVAFAYANKMRIAKVYNPDTGFKALTGRGASFHTDKSSAKLVFGIFTSLDGFERNSTSEGLGGDLQQPLRRWATSAY